MKHWLARTIIVLLTAAAIAVPLMLMSGAKADPDAPAALAVLGEASTLIKLYPIYAFASGLFAWLCWPRRKEITFILLSLLLLSALGILAAGLLVI